MKEFCFVTNAAAVLVLAWLLLVVSFIYFCGEIERGVVGVFVGFEL